VCIEAGCFRLVWCRRRVIVNDCATICMGMQLGTRVHYAGSMRMHSSSVVFRSFAFRYELSSLTYEFVRS
jgi:hypothetical protein